MNVGDRVITNSGRKGTLLRPTVNMPNHHMVKLDEGADIWVVKGAIALLVNEGQQ